MAQQILIPHALMQCFIYKSLKKPDLYVYLKNQDDFCCLPDALQQSLGKMEFVLSLDVTPERKLAHANPVSVLNNLQTHGYFLQLPPTQPASARLQ